MTSLSSTARLARFSASHPWRVVVAWLAILGVAIGIQILAPINSTTSSVLQNDPESQQGWDLLEAHGIRRDRSGIETIIIRSNALTIDDPQFEAAVRSITDALRLDADFVASVSNYYELNAKEPDSAARLVSTDRQTTIIPVTLTGDQDDALTLGDDVMNFVKNQRGASPGFEILTVGDASLFEEVTAITQEDLKRGEGIGASVAFLILLVVLGALVATMLPLVLAVMSIAIALGLTALISQVGQLSTFVTIIIPMLGLAVGIDYALFVVDRYREERRRGAGSLDAITIAGSTASRAVMFSGLTVVIALAGLFIIPTNIFRSFSVGAIVVVIVAVVATLTLIPAMIGLLGDRIEWPRRRRYGEAATIQQQVAYDRETIHGGFWGTITRAVMGRPVISLVLAAGFLILCTLPYLNFEPGIGGASGLPDGLETKQAYTILADEFSAGLISPVEIVIEGPQDDASVQQGIERLRAEMASATTDDGQPLFGPATLTTSPDNLVTLISVPLTVAPDTPAGNEAIERLRQEMIPPISGSMSDSRILVTGVTASNVDFLKMRDSHTPIVFAFVLGLSFLVLLVVFRSLVVAIKAIVMNLLSVGAAYGLIVWVFQEGNLIGLFSFQRVEAIEAYLPLLMFSILFGLSMDYQVFLLSRIREAYDHSHDNAEAVAIGLQRTGRIITGAALIMVAVFAGFASGRMSDLEQFGFGLGVAILFDATIVRSVLVPSAMALLGDWNWYLPRCLHWLPNVRVEGTAAESLPEATTAD